MSLFGPPNIEKLKARRNLEGLRKALEPRHAWEMRVKAALALTELGDHHGTSEFASLLKGLMFAQKDSTEAARALAAAGDEAVDMVGAILADPDLNVTSHSGAASVLAMIGSARSQDALMDVFERKPVDADRDFRMVEAAKALQKVAGERLVDRLLGHVEGRKAGLELHSRKIQAILVLGATGSDRAVEPLIAALAEEDAAEAGSVHKTRKVSRAAAIALGQIGDPRAVGPLIDALKWRETYHEVHQCARDALVNIGEEAVQPLAKALSDPDNQIRIGAAQTLGFIGARSAVPALLNVLTGPDGRAGGRHPDGDWLVAEAACWALGKIGDRGARPALMALIASDSLTSGVRDEARKVVDALA